MAYRGVNLGSWLLMEGYILGGRNIPEQTFKKAFQKQNGSRGLAQFEKLFRDHWIEEGDFKRIASWGATLVRVPFHYRLIEKKPYQYDAQGVKRLRHVFKLASRYGLKVVLDLHAACGSQNSDWHGDSLGQARFWDVVSYRRRTLALWEYLVDQFKDEPAFWALDAINEPILGNRPLSLLTSFYQDLIKGIRGVDKEVRIFIEGPTWAQEVDCLGDCLAEGVDVSIHTYRPEEFTFNFTRNLHYPGRIEGRKWDANQMRRYLEPYAKFASRQGVSILVGEFGLSYREPASGVLEWLKDMLMCFQEFDFHWTYWPYKSVPIGTWPDGMLQYSANNPWVCRQGPVVGWENYPALWAKEKKAIVQSWRSDNFKVMHPMLEILRNYF